jgi:hypothetical protein
VEDERSHTANPLRTEITKIAPIIKPLAFDMTSLFISEDEEIYIMKEILKTIKSNVKGNKKIERNRVKIIKNLVC